MLPANSLTFDTQGTRQGMVGRLMMWGKQQAALSLEAVLRWMKMQAALSLEAVLRWMKMILNWKRCNLILNCLTS